MYTEDNKKRMEQIHAMLMEFASGNFLYKLERTDRNDEIEALAALVNMTMEEIKGSFLHQGYVNQNETYGHLVQMLFILDKDDTIMTFNSGVKKMLFFNDDEVNGKPFYSFLTDKSKQAWNGLKSRLVDTGLGSHEEFIVLSLKTKQDLILTTKCLVCKPICEAGRSERTIVTSVEMVMGSGERELELRKKSGYRKDTHKIDKDVLRSKYRNRQTFLRSSDIRKVRQVRDHIMNNLDRQLSPLIELAHSFGTNEYKLKHGFKQLYGQTVFGFLISERLRKASVLIQHSDIPLKEVAHITGFKSAPHFSRAFKEKYGYTPRDLRKQS